MLTDLHIQNFAIVDQVDLALDRGMTVLTGETGAGKSILVDAIGLLLGDRAGPNMIKAGHERAELSMRLDLSGLPAAKKWLEDQELDNGDECFLRRTINMDGRSRGWLNDSPVPIQTLKNFGELLLAIHGQHAHQDLSREARQREILDHQAGLKPDLQELEELFQRWRTISESLQEIGNDSEATQHQIEFLSYQLTELENVNPTPDEYTQLVEEHERSAHAQESLASLAAARQLLMENEPDAITLVQQAIHQLQISSQYDSSAAEILKRLDGLMIELTEASEDLRHLQDRFDIDPDYLNQLENRLTTLHDLARKHHCQPSDLTSILEHIRTEINQLSSADERREHLQHELQVLYEAWIQKAQDIHQKREKVAQELSAEISKKMQSLGMDGGTMSIQVNTIPDIEPNVHGLDKITFLISPNPGQPLLPLAKIASGGELSRISLAIQVTTTADRDTPILIFDEVDAGVGGAIAEVIGKTLREVGQRKQVLCVTHLPQVAAQAHHHLRIIKTKDSHKTVTRIDPLLQPKQRVEELARMLGGIKVTEQTLEHAREMLITAQKQT